MAVKVVVMVVVADVVVAVMVIVAWVISGVVKSVTDNSPETTSSMPGMALIDVTRSVRRLPENELVSSERSTAAAGAALPVTPAGAIPAPASGTIVIA
jgi:hypothetical protein